MSCTTALCCLMAAAATPLRQNTPLKPPPQPQTQVDRQTHTYYQRSTNLLHDCSYHRCLFLPLFLLACDINPCRLLPLPNTTHTQPPPSTIVEYQERTQPGSNRPQTSHKRTSYRPHTAGYVVILWLFCTDRVREAQLPRTGADPEVQAAGRTRTACRSMQTV